MTTIAELLAQKAALETQIEAARKAENADAISKVRALVAEHGLTVKDVFGGAKAGRKSTGSVAAKYRDPETGKEWSGRGLAPKWLQGKDRAQFAI